MGSGRVCLKAARGTRVTAMSHGVAAVPSALRPGRRGTVVRGVGFVGHVGSVPRDSGGCTGMHDDLGMQTV